MDGWRRTAAMDVSDDSTTDVVDEIDDTRYFDDEVFIPGDRDGVRTREISTIVAR